MTRRSQATGGEGREQFVYAELSLCTKFGKAAFREETNPSTR